MINISLPDGSVRSFDKPVSGADIAASIGPGLAKAALALRVDGKMVDLSSVVDHDAKIGIVTSRDPEALELLRHDAAHVLAQAVQELYPGTQITFGPATEDGFYYDFVRAEPFSTEDFAKIEQRMAEIVDRNLPIVREVWDRAKIKDYFKQHGESFKAEWADELPKDEVISVYKQGDWLDMCLGPHLPSTGKLGKAFKLTKVSGAYWRGDAKNAQLQRVYGTIFFSDKDLKDYLHRLEEAEKRDHRKIGREMDLFHQQEDAAGMVYWHPKGWTFWRTLESYLRRKLEAGGYVEVKTPQLNDRRAVGSVGPLGEVPREHVSQRERGGPARVRRRSGQAHLRAEADELPVPHPALQSGPAQLSRAAAAPGRDGLVPPFRAVGSAARHPAGACLHAGRRPHLLQRGADRERDDPLLQAAGRGLSRPGVRVLREVLRSPAGAHRLRRRSGTRPKAALKSASKAAGLDLILNPGEGAFYGPKLEFVLRDAIGRDWQCGTLQVDFMLPERLGATYVAEDGGRKVPVMLHRAIFGSFERMIGVLIEHYAGRFPLWLAPTQAVVATIVNDADAYAGEVADKLRAAGMRVEMDLRNEKINYKVREHSLAHVPLILAVGRRDMEGRTVAVRRLGSDKQEVLELGAAVTKLSEEARPPF